MQALQLILTLTILVFVHELGHFTFAKLFGARVDKFYLFFNPWFSIFKFQKGETTYGIGWLPLGGYCKIAGMVDESLDREGLASEPQEWEYRAKPLWQRMLIITGGVLYNFIAAILIYSAISFAWGKTYLPLENAKYGIYCDSTALNMGLQHGDKIVKIGDYTPQTMPDAVSQILLDGEKSLTVNRNGNLVELPIPSDLPQQIIASNSYFITTNVPFFVDSIMANSPAAQSQLRVGDQIVAVDSIETTSYYDFVRTAPQFAGDSVELTIIRHGYRERIPLCFSAEGKLGVWARPAETLFEFRTEKFTLLQSIPEGISLGINTLVFYIKQFKLIFTKEGATQIGSFVSMGKLYDESWNWQSFWSLAALFSVILAFMNILPIPGLDGGHLLFLLYELVARRKPSDDFLFKAQKWGMIILFSIFFYALFLDFGRL